VLEINNLKICYGDMLAVNNISLKIDEGEIVTIVGANGAGKSTILKTISGVHPISAGQIIFQGERIDNIPSHQIVERRLIHVPEARRVFPYMSVWENLLVASQSKAAKVKRSEILKAVFEILPQLYDRKKQLAGSLSGGQQQMLAIGRGLMADPKLIMLDEPSLGLSPLLVMQVFEKIAQINKQKVTVLLVEQNVTRALSMADRGYVLENGSIVMKGKGTELLANEYLRKAYLGM